MAQIKLSEYTFDSTNESTNMPTLIPNTITMTTEDVVISDTVTKRTVYIDNTVMPTQIKMGGLGILEVYYLNIDSNITNMNRLFHYSRSLTYVNTEGWDTKNVTDMACMFEATKLTKLDLSHWNTSNVKDAGYMFCNTPIKSVNLNGWDMSKVTTCGNIFAQCLNLETVDMTLSTNLSACSSFYEMFSGCKKLKTIKGTDTWKIQNATDFSKMFYLCNSLQDIKGLEDWNVSKVTSFGNMFSGCSSLTSLDLSSFDTKSVTNMSGMFNGWTSNQTVYYEPPYWSIGTTTLNSNINWVVNVTRNNGYWLDMTGITGATEITLFNENNLPTEEILTDWGDGTQNSNLTHTYSTAGKYVVVSNLQIGATLQKIGAYTTKAVIYYYTNPGELFFGFSKMTEAVLTDHYIELVNEKKPKNFNRMFYSTKLQKLPNNLNKIDTSSATSMGQMFYGLQSLTEQDIDLTWMNVSNVTDMNGMFEWGTTIRSLNTTGWNTSKVQKMSNMFHGTRGLTNLDLSHWNVSGCTNMSGMFDEAIGLTSLDLSSWNISSVTNMTGMFRGCSNLQTIDVSNWNTSNVETMDTMFYNCSKLTTLDVGNFDTSKVTNVNSMFQGCTNLTTLDASEWVTSKVTNINSMFQGCTNLTTLDASEWDTSKVTTMNNTFNSCTNLQTIDVSKWDTSKVTTMGSMFYGCSNLQTLDVSNWVTSSVVNMTHMFNRCVNLTTLDISNFNVSNATMDSMFKNCSVLKTIGMIYSNAESINKIVELHKPNGLVVYYYDADPSQLIPVEGVTFKKYATSTTIQLPPHIQLHSLPDGVRDELDIKTGILTRNIKQIDLNGDESWTIWTPDSNETYTTFASSNIIRLVVTNKQTYQLKGGNLPWYVSSDTIKHDEYIRLHNRKIFITFNNNNINSVKNLKLYLQNNPITIHEAHLKPTTEQLIINYNNSCDYGRILPTGMCDKYDVVNSMYTQTMTSILLDGENTWDGMEEFENTIKFTATGTTVGVGNLNMLGAGGLYCDNDLFPNINDDSDVEHCRVDEAGNKFYIYVDKERLMSPDLIGWQIWLQENKFNMTYELAEHLTYAKPYEELDPTQARWEGMDCMRDGTIRYHANNSDNITLYPTLEYVAPSINNFEVPMLEPNTEYTMYAEAIGEGDTIKLGGADIQFKNGKVFTSGDNQWLRIDNNDSFYNMVITRGDTTGEHVPYFEGMASVEMPVLKTMGKNLFTKNNLTVDGYIVSDGRVITQLNDNRNATDYIEVLPDTTYTMSGVKNSGIGGGNSAQYVAFYDKNKKYLTYAHVNVTSDKFSITTSSETIYIRMSVRNADIDRLQIEKGTTATTYEPYKSNILSFNEPVKLRSLPNGVKDTINVVTGEYIQRVGEITLKGWDDGGNGELYWVVGEDNQNNGETMYFGFKGIDSLIKVQDDESHDVFVSDFFKQGDTWRSDEECVDVVSRQNAIKLRIRLKKSRLATLDKDGLMEWLSNNPITIQYELAEPIITKLDPQTLLAFDDGTINLSSDTGILPTVHYTVPSTNTFYLPSMKTGTRYTLKYPSASGSIIIGDINYSISSDSMLFTTPLKINGDTSAIIFSDANPENVILLEGAYNKREVPFFTGVKSVKNPNITIIDQLSTESTTYNCETEIELRGLPNGVADKLDIVKGKLTTNVGIRPYKEGDENLPNIWTDGYETVYALSSPIVRNVAFNHPTVTTNSSIKLSSDCLIPQLNYRAPSSNNFPLDLLQPNQTYTLYADTLTSGSYTLGGTKTGIYSQPHTIALGDMTDNLLTFNGDLGLSNVMLVKGNSLKTSLPPYFLGIRSVTDGHLLVEGMQGEVNELTFDEGIVLRDCNGVKDTIDLITGTLTKRTGEITLTGVEGWYRVDNESTTDYNVFKLTLGGLKEALVVCDTLHSVFDSKAMDCIYAHTNELCVVIANATIGGDNVNALKSWLNQHPTTVIYQLRIPVEVQLKNVWTTLPPTSYDNQTKISSTVSSTSLKPMISVTIATTTLEEIVSQLEQQNAELQAQNESLEQENVATMLALTDLYETMVAPMMATPMAVMSLDSDPYAMSTMSLDDEELATNVVGYTVSPMSMIYAKLVHRGLKTMHEVPYNLQVEVMYALKGME